MPLGDPPKKPPADAPDAEHEKYRKEIDKYVTQRLKEVKVAEDNLATEKTSIDARFVKLGEKERELAIKQTEFEAAKETLRAGQESLEADEALLKENELAYSKKLVQLKEDEAAVKTEDRRLKLWARDLEDRGHGGGGGIPPGLEDILLQQKTLLESRSSWKRKEKRGKKMKRKREPNKV